MAQRYRLALRYCGSRYRGWQAPDGRSTPRKCFRPELSPEANDDSLGAQSSGTKWVPTVQGALEDALSAIVGENNFSRVYGSSRTDAGVHALRNVCHVDLLRRCKRSGNVRDPFPAETLHRALNYRLRFDDVCILESEAVSDSFHSRFDAIARTYLYRMAVVGHSAEDASAWPAKRYFTFEKDRAWCVNGPMDVEAMSQVGALLVGRHDFSAFRSSGCQASSPVRTMLNVEVSRGHLFTGHNADGVPSQPFLIEIRLTANAFLYNMVCNIVGMLKEVGAGRLSVQDANDIFEGRNRCRGPAPAPPQGLYLVDVHYNSV